MTRQRRPVAGRRGPSCGGRRLDWCQVLPGFGHPAARPATGGLAEHLRKLPLGDRLAILDAGTVGGVDVDLTATVTSRRRPTGNLVPVVRGLVRMVRVVRYVQARAGPRVRERCRNLRQRIVPDDGVRVR